MHRIIRTKAYEAEHGPHFNEEYARKAVNKMEMKTEQEVNIGHQKKLQHQLINMVFVQMKR